MSVRGVDHEHIHASRNERPGPLPIVAGRADRGRHAEATMLVLVRVRILSPLVDVLDRDQPAQRAIGIDDRQLLDAVLAQDPFGFVERRAGRRGDETAAGHRLAHRPIEIALELQVAVRE